MMNVRIKFKKESKSKFISHLDLMRTFQRAMRRARLPMVYSGGYNPHPEMSFAQALGLGISSIGEYMDIKIDDELSAEYIKSELNKTLPIGIEVTVVRLLKEKAKPAMSQVTHGQYIITVGYKTDKKAAVIEKLEGFSKQENIITKKKQFKKNDIVEVNIRPLIEKFSFKIKENQDEIEINCTVACGSVANLKPELIVKAFEEYSNIQSAFYRIQRTELLVKAGNEFISVLDIDNK